MMVPHGSGRTFHLNIPLPLALVALVGWTTLTFWASYLSAQQVDYWRAELSNRVLRMKVQYLVDQVEKTRGFIDDVRHVEGQLRDLLGYKNKFSIISDETSADASTGGPTASDAADLARTLASQPADLNWKKLIKHVKTLRMEAETRLSSYDDLTRWIGHQRDLYRATPRGWPAAGYLASHFGRRVDPFSGMYERHYGIDISGPVGTPVKATADGVVKLSSWHSGYGKLVVIQHRHGYETRYAHNSQLLVRVGDEVRRGQVVALMGNTGKSSGPHCHYEVVHKKRRVNPYAYLKGAFPEIHASALQAAAKQVDEPDRG